MIRKVPGGYKVVSHRTGRPLGPVESKAEATRRLRQIKGHAPSSTPSKYRRTQHPNN